MNWFKTTLAVAGLVVASSAAQAGTIANPDRVSFNEGRVLLDATKGAASTTISTAAKPNTVVDGAVQIDATNIQYWWARRSGQSSSAAKKEQAKSWNFTLTHDGQTADLGGLPSAKTNYWFTTTAFDGVTAGGDWVLTANSDYNPSRKRMIEFNLAGFFDTAAAPGGSSSSSSSSGGGSVPVPASALFVLMGLAGIGAASRRNKSKA